MSLNKLKDALQNYQNSYSECLGISPSFPAQGPAKSLSAPPQPEFKFEIPDTTEIAPIPESASSAQTEKDEDIPQLKYNPFPESGEAYKEQQPNPSNHNRQRRTSSHKKKKGFKFITILLLCVLIMLCGMGYTIYDFYSSKKTGIPSSSQSEMRLNHEIQQENTQELSHHK